MSSHRVHATVRSAIFPTLRREASFEPGVNCQEILDGLAIPARYRDLLRVFVGDTLVPALWWSRVHPHPGVPVSIAVVPALGDDALGKGMTRTLVSLASTLGGAAIAAATGVGGIAAWGITTAMSLAGTLAATAFIPIPEDSLESRSYAVTASQNAARPYEVIPKVYGRTRIYPPLAAKPVTEFVGQDQYINLVFCCGYKPLYLDRSTFKIGESPLDDFNVEDGGPVVQIEDDWEHPNREITIYTSDVNEEIIDRTLVHCPLWTDENVFRRRTEANAKRVSLDFVFPEGLYDEEGRDMVDVLVDTAVYGLGGLIRKTPVPSVDIEIRYKPVVTTGEDAWIYVIPTWSLENARGKVTIETAGRNMLAWFGDDIPSVFAFLKAVSDALVTHVTAMEAIAEVDRIASQDLVDYALARIQDAISNIDNHQAVADRKIITEAQMAIMLAAEAALADLKAVVDTTTISTGDPQNEYTNALSLAVRLINVTWKFNPGSLRDVQKSGAGPANAKEAFGDPPTGAFNISTATEQQSLYRMTLAWDLPEVGRYDVEIRRTNKVGGDKVHDRIDLYAYRTFLDEVWITPTMREICTLVAIRMRASDQLSSSVQMFNCIAESPLPWHNGADWQDAALVDGAGRRVSRNPAWQFADVLKGAANRKPLTDDDRVDVTRLLEFAEACYTGRYTFDGVFDKSVTVDSVLNDICRVAKASPLIRDGLYSLVQDRIQTVPAAIITPRNSRNLRSSKVFADIPHALRIRYQDIDAGYTVSEWFVYDDTHGPEFGLPEPETIEDVDLFGVTDSKQADTGNQTGLVHRIGRYMLACITLRPETMMVRMDWEALTFERGDLVLVQHDVPMWGVGSGRIRSITLDGTYIASVVLDTEVSFEAWKSYLAKVRAEDGTILSGDLLTEAGSTATLTFVNPLDPGSSTVSVGCLVPIAERTTNMIECLVKEIDHDNDLECEITLVEAAPAVHLADTEPIPQYDPRITIPADHPLAAPPAPNILRIQTDEQALYRQSNGSLESRILLSVEVPSGQTAYERVGAANVSHLEAQYRITRIAGTGEEERFRTMTPIWARVPNTPRDSQQVIIAPVEDGSSYDVRVRAVSRYGPVSPWRYALDLYVIGKQTPPQDVQNVRLERNVLTWDYVAPIDHAGFMVRHVFGFGGRWESGVASHDGLLLENRFVLPDGDSGYCQYMVKAVDTSGNVSLHDDRLEVFKEIPNHYVNAGETLEEGNPGKLSANMQFNGGWGKWITVENGTDTLDFFNFPSLPRPRLFFSWAEDSGGSPFNTKRFPDACLGVWAIPPTDLEIDYPIELHIQVDAVGENWYILIPGFIDDDELWKPPAIRERFWPESMSQPLWPDFMDADQYFPYRGPIRFKRPMYIGYGFLFYIVVPESNVQFQTTSIRAIWAAPKLSETASSYEIDLGTMVYGEIPASNSFRRILNMVVSLSDDENQNDEAKYVDAVVQLPLAVPAKASVLIRKVGGDPVSGLIDYTVEGY